MLSFHKWINTKYQQPTVIQTHNIYESKSASHVWLVRKVFTRKLIIESISLFNWWKIMCVGKSFIFGSLFFYFLFSWLFHISLLLFTTTNLFFFSYLECGACFCECNGCACVFAINKQLNHTSFEFSLEYQ